MAIPNREVGGGAACEIGFDPAHRRCLMYYAWGPMGCLPGTRGSVTSPPSLLMAPGVWAGAWVVVGWPGWSSNCVCCLITRFKVG